MMVLMTVKARYKYKSSMLKLFRLPLLPKLLYRLSKRVKDFNLWGNPDRGFLKSKNVIIYCHASVCG
jgi:hypothetical protein